MRVMTICIDVVNVALLPGQRAMTESPALYRSTTRPCPAPRLLPRPARERGRLGGLACPASRPRDRDRDDLRTICKISN